MDISKKRERQIKITIYVVSFFLLLITVLILFWTGVVQFDWSNKIVESYKYEENKNKDKKILIIGDSQLENWPQINCLYKSMEAFSENNDIGYVNAAHYGFGPIEYLDQIKKIAPDYKPDLIVVYYYAGNDLTDVMLRGDRMPKEPTRPLIPQDEKDGKKVKPKEPTAYDIEHALSKFDWEAFKNKGIDSLMIEYAKNRVRNPNKIGPEYVNPYVLNMANWNDNYLIDNLMIKSARCKNGWYDILKMFEEMIEISEELNAQFAIVSIPSTVQVDTSHFDFYKKNTFITPNEITKANQPQQYLTEFASAMKIKYVDLLPYYKNHKNTYDLYFENDDHLSEEGHNYAFSLVEKEIFIPFKKGGLQSYGKQRVKDFYKKYTDWAVAHQINTIKNDSNWYYGVVKKAEEQGLSIDEMLLQDAKFCVKDREN